MNFIGTSALALQPLPAADSGQRGGHRSCLALDDGVLDDGVLDDGASEILPGSRRNGWKSILRKGRFIVGVRGRSSKTPGFSILNKR
jgi:hypothetical protein